MLMPQRDDGCRPHLQIGARNFGRQECLELALELVIVHQPTWISAISQRLLDLQPVHPTVSLFGISFKRSRLIAWAARVDLPENTHPPSNQEQIDAELLRGDRENVHPGPVTQHGVRQIRKMQCCGNQCKRRSSLAITNIFPMQD